MTIYNPTDFTTLKNAKNAANPDDEIVVPVGGITINDQLFLARTGYKIRGAASTGCAIKWDPAAPRKGSMIQFDPTASAITLQDLEVDGASVGGIAVQAKAGAHNLIFQNVFTHACTGNGFGVEACDYVYHLGCQSWRNGPPSLTDGSGFSWNAGGATIADDGYNGFHIVYVNCISTGSEGRPADGNGYIADNGNVAGVITVPNMLYLNCLASWNGGRGFHNYRCAGRAGARGIVAVNCASRHNGLDVANMGTPPGTRSSPLGEFSNDQGTMTLINCWADPWHGPATANYGTKPYANINGGTLTLVNCLERSGGRYASDVSVGSFSTNPWVSPLAAPTDSGTSQHLSAPDTRTLAATLQVLAGSALHNTGADPLAVPGFTANQLNDLRTYVYHDLLGFPRPAA